MAVPVGAQNVCDPEGSKGVAPLGVVSVTPVASSVNQRAVRAVSLEFGQKMAPAGVDSVNLTMTGAGTGSVGGTGSGSVGAVVTSGWGSGSGSGQASGSSEAS